MGIKTATTFLFQNILSLKNLPTTWGLRLFLYMINNNSLNSEKPPHHMGIKTHKPKNH